MNTKIKQALHILLIIIALFSIASPADAQKKLEIEILFKTDSTNIMESQKPQLGLMAQYIKNHPDETIVIGGFTSKNTAESRIEGLTLKRAENVMFYLIKNFQINPQKIIHMGVGISERYKEPEQNEVVSFFKL